MRKITVSDYTLKKMNDERNSSLLFREKTAIATSIDSFGADRIELAPVENVKEDTIVYKTISSFVKNAFVCVPVGFTKESVNTAFECVKEAVKPCLQVVLPVSTVQMEYTYHYKEEKMLFKAEELCKASKELCNDVEFCALDATRADRAFLLKIIETAVQNGATSVTVCDDAGIFLPDDFCSLVKEIKNIISVPLFVCVSDAINVGAANAFAAVSAGADGVKTAVAGENALLCDRFAKLIETKGEDIGICSSLKTTEIHSDIKTLLKKVKSSASSGENGGAKKSAGVFLDSESSVSQLTGAVEMLGYELTDDDIGKVYEALMRVCEKKSSVGAEELEAIIASSAMQVPSTYHLESYNATSSNVTSAMSYVVLKKGDEKINGVAMGDGPIDSSFKAIEQAVGYHYELDDFEIQAVTEGKEALGCAVVKLRSNGKLYSGNGLSTDIVGASIRAYVNALNKIVFEE